MKPEPLKCKAVKFYIRKVGEETALDLLCQLDLLSPDFFTETPIEAVTEVHIKISIEFFTEVPIEVPIKFFTEVSIEAVAETLIVKFYDEAPVKATIMKVFTKSVA